MDNKKSFFYEPWPAISYEEAQSTLYLLHRFAQIIGKLKLTEPFEPHWDGVILHLTSRGFTTGPINYRFAAFNIDIDLIDHQVICNTSWGKIGKCKLTDMSVADFARLFFNILRECDIDVSINNMPMEVPDPVLFTKDTEQRSYDAKIANKWHHILLSTQRVMQRYHAKFKGRTPPIGLMWGTLDLRDVRYKGTPLSIDSTLDYIRRNAMDDAQIEVGWWCGNAAYPRPAFFSFTYPKPIDIELATVQPDAARWDASMGEFLFDYDDLRRSDDPDRDLLLFFDSTYQAGAARADWSPELVSTGKPV